MAKGSKVSNIFLVGRWSFLIGLVIAILSGIPGFPAIGWVLVVLGIIVGFLNINAVETGPFLVAVVALMLSVNIANSSPSMMDSVGMIFDNVILFLTPATIIVSLKAIYVLARN